MRHSVLGLITKQGVGGLKYSSDFQVDGRLARFGTIRHFSPSEVKLASANALSSFMVRKIKCQTHLSLESHPLPPSTPQPADWASSHPCHVIWCSSQTPANNSIGGSSSSNPHMNSKHFTVYLVTIQIVPVLAFFSLSPLQSLKSPRCI